MKNFWKGKKVIVTGASGFIGSNAVDALVDKGARVSAIVSKKSNQNRAKSNLSDSLSKIKLVSCDLLNPESCLKVFKNHDYVLNFAAMDGSRAFKAKYSADIFKTNVQIVLNVLEAARINKLDRVLLLSSTEVYENDKNDGYIQSKKLSEIAARLYFQEYGMKISVARPGNTYGPHDSAGKEKGRVIPTFISKSLSRKKIEIWGSGRQENSFIYVGDLIRGLLSLVERYPNPDPINFVSSSAISISDLANQIIKLTGTKSGISYVKFEELDIKRRRVSSDRAKRLIGFEEKTEFSEGLKKTIEYIKNVGSNKQNK